MTVPSGLGRLRAATAPLHDHVEALVGLGPPPTLEGYGRFLTLWWRFLTPLEASLLGGSAPPELELPERIKLPWLCADLDALGVDAAARENLPIGPLALPAHAPWPRRLGFLYVIEGATLGGQILLRQVAAALPQASGATRFVRSYGEAVGPRWRALCAELERQLADPSAEAQIVGAACEAFTAFAALASPLGAEIADLAAAR